MTGGGGKFEFDIVFFFPRGIPGPLSQMRARFIT